MRSASRVIALPTANALDVQRGVAAEMARLEPAFPPGLAVPDRLRHDDGRAGVDRRGRRDAGEAVGAGRPRDVRVPPELARHAHPGADACRCRSSARSRSCKLLGFSINTLTLFAIVLATGIVVDDAIVVIENIERHIQEYGKPRGAGGVGRDARGVRRGHRDGARADRGVRAGRVLPGHDRAAVSAVRADDRVLGGDLRVQRADADAGAVGAAAPARAQRGQAAGSSARSSAASARGTNVYVRVLSRADAGALGDGAWSSSACSG